MFYLAGLRSQDKLIAEQNTFRPVHTIADITFLSRLRNFAPSKFAQTQSSKFAQTQSDQSSDQQWKSSKWIYPIVVCCLPKVLLFPQLYILVIVLSNF